MPFTLKHDERFTIRLEHQINQHESKRLDCYFSIPKEMGVNPNTLDTDRFIMANVNGRRAYVSQMMDLPLVQSRFISRMKKDPASYRINLNVFVYHCLQALERETTELQRIESPDDFYQALRPVMDLLESMLIRFRDAQPHEPRWQVYFEQADNYLSWMIEQRLLKFLSRVQKSSSSQEERQRVLEFCQAERNYREIQRYNSSVTMADPNRIANKMILLKRLIEQGVVFKEETHELGRFARKLVKGIATALVMVVVYSLVIEATSLLRGVTVALVGVLAIIYGFREIFKDDIRQVIWNYLQRGRPIFLRRLIDGVSKKMVAQQKIWFSFIGQSDLPKHIDKMLRRRHQQNRQDAEFLYYRIDTMTYPESFRKGYQGIQEQIMFELSPLARHLERGRSSVFTEQNGKISKSPIEKRYQMNLVVGIGVDHDSKVIKECQEFHRYKVTVNRSGIVEVEYGGEVIKERDSTRSSG